LGSNVYRSYHMPDIGTRQHHVKENRYSGICL